MSLSRRDFLARSSAVTAAFGALHLLGQRDSLGDSLGRAIAAGNDPVIGYGELVRDVTGILDLPPGFRYSIVSRVGDTMDDGFFVPGKPDGMAAFPGPRLEITVLVRNHEITDDASWGGAFGPDHALLARVPPELIYDAGRAAPPGLKPCLGGTTTVHFNTRTQRIERQFLSLAGTAYNCAGGRTPWGSWLSCEETTQRREKHFEQDHGYVFEVPSSAAGLVTPVPYKAMGRFRREACGVNPDNSIVYMTEDVEDGLLYRFIPHVPRQLGRGGRLQAMVALDSPSLDSRNWAPPDAPSPAGAGVPAPTVPTGARLRIGWIDIEDVESPDDSLRTQGFARGAIKFARAEGAWMGREGLYFACTTGGRNKQGQIWRYTPPAPAVEGTPREAASIDTSGSLTLFFESTDTAAMANADNITMAPWGDLIVCEDMVAANDGGGAIPRGRRQYLLGITPSAQVYKFARNVLGLSEFAGCTFSPDGSTLFVNLQGNGLTLAVTGPWKHA
ncbi:MAG: alkaline phosphatase PhoX [Phycisphaerales bacterium]